MVGLGLFWFIGFFGEDGERGGIWVLKFLAFIFYDTQTYSSQTVEASFKLRHTTAVKYFSLLFSFF